MIPVQFLLVKLFLTKIRKVRLFGSHDSPPFGPGDVPVDLYVVRLDVSTDMTKFECRVDDTLRWPDATERQATGTHAAFLVAESATHLLSPNLAIKFPDFPVDGLAGVFVKPVAPPPSPMHVTQLLWAVVSGGLVAVFAFHGKLMGGVVR